MDKGQALHAFWSSFGLQAYDRNTVPDNAKLPYITYEVLEGSFGDGDIPLSADLWYLGDSWASVSQKADEISWYIGMGGINVFTDTGYIWIKRQPMFAQRMSDNRNDKIRRIHLNVAAEFIDY